MSIRTFLENIGEKLFLAFSAIAVVISFGIYPPYSILFGNTFVRNELFFANVMVIINVMMVVVCISKNSRATDYLLPLIIIAETAVPILLGFEGRSVVTDGFFFAILYSATMPYCICKRNRTASIVCLSVWGIIAVFVILSLVRGILDYQIASRILLLPLVLFSSLCTAFSMKKMTILTFLPTAAVAVTVFINIFGD